MKWVVRPFIRLCKIIGGLCILLIIVNFVIQKITTLSSEIKFTNCFRLV